MSEFKFSLQEILSNDFGTSVLRAHKRQIVGGNKRVSTTGASKGGPPMFETAEVMMNQGLTNSFPSTSANLSEGLEPFLISAMGALENAGTSLDIFSPFIPDDISKMADYLDSKGKLPKRSSMVTGASVTGTPASAGGPLVGGSAEEQIWNALRAHGLSPNAVAGIMGNIQAESGFNPGIEEKGTTRKDKGYGLCQWTFGRRTALEAYAVSVGKPSNDLGMQIDYLWKELTESYRTVLERLQDPNVTIDDATYVFLSKFEIPANISGVYPGRLRFAKDILERWKGK